jgi:hypothetical protein
VKRDLPEAMLIVLGAGASWDCLPKGVSDSTHIDGTILGGVELKDVRPALTQQLAEARLMTNWATQRWQSATPVISYLRRVLDSSAAHSGDE